MRILCAVALAVSLSVSCVKAVSFQSPQAQSQLTPGTSFQVAWGWDSPPRADDGTLDIYLVRDSAATSVVSQIMTGALILYSATSATIPTGTPAGQYYLQLRVTSGTEKSAIGGPFNVATGPAVIVSNSTTTTVTVGGGTVTSYVLPTDSPQTSTVNSAAPNTQQSLAGGAIAGIIIGTLIAFVSLYKFDASGNHWNQH
jgi:Ser-Thr-rich glycosyl-phosphatidyl-inositol-anchored membrane family